MTATAARAPASSDAFVRLWLWTLAALVFAMVLVGGATRLTDSGLSITEWQPILGAIPPLNDAQWLEAFDKYKAIPEYRIVNRGMSLAEFKGIFWWEWTHRFLGRFIGLVLIVPFALLWITRRLDDHMTRPLLLLLLLGALQGALGWYMVRSGLAERTDVSQYRLAAHLLFAAAIYAFIIWIAAGLTFGRARHGDRGGAAALALLFLIFLQIGLGGLVAGLDAGLSHNTFPLMDGKLIPERLMIMEPRWRNFFENAMTVQFLHRLIAYVIAVTALLHAARLWRSEADKPQKLSATAVCVLVILQMALGIWTLLAGVPMVLGLLHHAGAMLLLTAGVIHLHAARRPI
jgi:cytochrome c oxidase assembly protein subunit 15